MAKQWGVTGNLSAMEELQYRADLFMLDSLWDMPMAFFSGALANSFGFCHSFHRHTTSRKSLIRKSVHPFDRTDRDLGCGPMLEAVDGWSKTAPFYSHAK